MSNFVSANGDHINMDHVISVREDDSGSSESVVVTYSNQDEGAMGVRYYGEMREAILRYIIRSR